MGPVEPGPDQEIPVSLPLLDRFLEERVGGRRPLRGVRTVLIQHQLGSQVPMTAALLHLGVAAEDLYWIDIPYTANGSVHRALVELGIPEDNFAPSYYHLEMPYGSYQHLRVQELALEMLESLEKGEPLLVLDDGSYFLEALACFAASHPDVRIVEQTTRGLIKIRGDATLRERCSSVTLVNVAESRPKKEIEGPWIGEAVTRSLIERLRAQPSLQRDGETLVLGFGHIGQSVAASLVSQLEMRREQILVMDPKPNAQEEARGLGYGLWSRESDEQRRFSLVVGCSGTTSFSVRDRTYLEDGAILASASSGSAELSREGFIELADTHPGVDIRVDDRETLFCRSVHSDIGMHLVDRDVVFLNGGFPVNFDGRVNCVAPQYIQVTHTLQVGAALEAMGQTATGLQAVSDELCGWVEKCFCDLVKSGRDDRRDDRPKR